MGFENCKTIFYDDMKNGMFLKKTAFLFTTTKSSFMTYERDASSKAKFIPL